MKILISTGEVSGDIVGARLAAEILRRRPEASIYGVGGSRMAAAGVAIDFGTNHLATVGFTEPLFALPAFARVIARIRRRVREDRPDVAVLIGNDIFNVLLGRWLKSRGVRTVSYLPPQVWIWRSLAWLFAKSFGQILTSFPDEQRVYERTGVPTRFVGHYLCETLKPVTADERERARRKFGLPPAATIVGLLPGSRLQEIRRLAPILLDAAALLRGRHPDLKFVLPVAEPIYVERLEREIGRRSLSERVVLTGSDHDALRAADLLLLASGTATLEAALLGIPMVIVYRVDAFTMWVVRTAIRLGWMDSETLGLPNLVLGRLAVPEVRQEALNAPAVASAAMSILDDAGRAAEIREALAQVRLTLSGADVLGTVADEVLAAAGWAGAAAPALQPALPRVDFDPILARTTKEGN